MKPTRRTAAIVLVGAFALSACGGSNDSGDGTPETDASSGADPVSTPSPDGPNATIAPDLPDALEGLIGPVEVIGNALPPLETVDFTDDPAVGTPAPVLVGRGYDGQTIRIDAKASGPTMVVFLAHWCSHCNAEIPVLNQLSDDDRIPADVNVVAVSTAVAPGQPNFPPDQWLTDKDWTFPAIADGVDMQSESFIGAGAFGVTGFPFITLIDANGNVAARWSGEREPSEIASLLASLPNIA